MSSVPCRYKSGVRGSSAASVRAGGGGGGGGVAASTGNGGGGGGAGSGRLCEVRRAYKAAVVPCKTGRRRARGMSMGQKVSGGVKAVNGRDAAAPYKPVIPRELAQVIVAPLFYYCAQICWPTLEEVRRYLLAQWRIIYARTHAPVHIN